MKPQSSIPRAGRIKGEEIALLCVPSLACSARTERGPSGMSRSSSSLCCCDPGLPLPFGPPPLSTEPHRAFPQLLATGDTALATAVAPWCRGAMAQLWHGHKAVPLGILDHLLLFLSGDFPALYRAGAAAGPWDRGCLSSTQINPDL